MARSQAIAYVRIMASTSNRSVLLGHVSIAHLAGLAVTTVGIGFRSPMGLSGVEPFLFILGAFLSIPWFGLLVVAIWFWGEWLSEHPVPLIVGGPIIVCASYWLVVGPPFFEEVAVSSTVSSVVVWFLRLFRKRPDLPIDEMRNAAE